MSNPERREDMRQMSSTTAVGSSKVGGHLMILPPGVEAACADPNTLASAYEGLRPFLYACPTAALCNFILQF